MAEEFIFDMEDDKTPAEFLEGDTANVEGTKKEVQSQLAATVAEEDEDAGADNHECTVVDPGLMAEFMAAHPEDKLAQEAQAAKQSSQPVKTAPQPKGFTFPVKKDDSQMDEEDEEPPEGKTSIATLADIEAMAAEMSGEKSAAKAADRMADRTPAQASAPVQKRRPSGQQARAAVSEPAEKQIEYPLDGNTLNSPVEAAIKPVLDDLPRAKRRPTPSLDQNGGLLTGSRPAISAPVEEMEDMWDNIDDQDMGEWSARSAEHKAVADNGSRSVQQQNTDEIPQGAASQVREEARLICLSGELHGQEFPVTQHDISIGRQDGNTITIRDGSLSRQHASIVKNEDVYMVVDNNSSNGTFVNGQRIDRARLHSGDEIAFGNVAFRFIELGDAFKPGAVAQQAAPLEQAASQAARQQNQVASKKPPKRFIMAVGGVVLIVGILFGLVLNKVRAPKGEQIDASQVRALYNDGVANFKGRKWADSLRQFTTLSQLEPESKLARRYLKRIKIEAEIEQRLGGIQKSITEGLLQEAAGLLDKIPPQTVYVAEVAIIKGQIDSESQKQLARVRTIIDGDAAAEALPLIENLRSQLPVSYKEQLDDLVESANQKIAQAQEKEAAAVAAKSGARSVTRRHVDRTDDQAIALFKEKKIQAALNLLADKGAPNQSAPAELVSLYNKISKFDEAYQSARQEWQAKSVDEAIPALRKAINLEDKIASGKSPYAKELRQWVADMLHIKGLRAFSAKQYPVAYQNFQEAINNYPNHAPSRNKLNELSAIAEDYYRKAYISKNADPTQCKALLNQVLRMVSPLDPLHAKAKDLLSTLP